MRELDCDFHYTDRPREVVTCPRSYSKLQNWNLNRCCNAFLWLPGIYLLVSAQPEQWMARCHRRALIVVVPLLCLCRFFCCPWVPSRPRVAMTDNLLWIHLWEWREEGHWGSWQGSAWEPVGWAVRGRGPGQVDHSHRCPGSMPTLEWCPQAAQGQSLLRQNEPLSFLRDPEGCELWSSIISKQR